MSGTAITPLTRTRRQLTTPDWLVRSLVAVVILAGLALGACLCTAAAISDAARTIGQDAEPSVALALRLAATLGDLNVAVLADSLTDGGSAVGTSRRFRDSLDQIDADLIAAARNITYGEAEAAPLRELAQSLSLYEEAVVEARFRGQGDAWLATRRVQWASRVNQMMAVPQAEALAAANANELERHYAGYRQSSMLLGLASCVGFVLLVAMLLALQVWLARRTRRLVNLPLAAATLIALASLVWFATAVINERNDLRSAKADAYDSLHVLFAAKSLANTIRADMSLWLLDPDARKEAQTRIAASLQQMIGSDLSRPDQLRAVLDALMRAQELEKSGQATKALAATPHFGGLLGTELDNVTFGPAERSAATDSVAALGNAERLMGQIQLRDQQGAHREALMAWLSDERGGAAGAFNALQAALDRTIAVNQRAFDQHVSTALSVASVMPWIAGVGVGLTVLLAGGGIWLRLREYR